jgi:hypothetical protein
VPIVRNIKNNQFYRYHGGNTYTNLHTGVKGEIKESVAKNVLKINLGMTEMLAAHSWIEEYPLVLDMISRLKLVLEK